MEYYYEIQRYDADPVYITPDQQLQIKQAMLGGSKHIYLPDPLPPVIAVSNIKGIELSEKPIPSVVKQLESGQRTGKREPIMNEDNTAVLMEPCKRTLPRKIYDKQVAGHTRHIVIESDNKTVTYIKNMVMYTTGHAEGWTPLTSDEIRKYLTPLAK